MFDAEAFGGRVLRAWLAYQARVGRRMPQTELTALVNDRMAAEGSDATVTAATVSRWFYGQVPDLWTLGVLAAVLEVDPGWLAFGDDTSAAGPAKPGPRPALGEPDGGLGGRGVHGL